MMLATMENKLKGVHVGFIFQVTRMKAKSQKDGSWRKVGLGRVIQGAGTQPLQNHIDRRQMKVAEWVDLLTTFEVCANKTGCEGGWRPWDPWWWQAAAEK